MRKNATLLHLMTIFLAVIGLCAATLSGYILFYSQFPHPSTSKIDIVASPEITTAQVNNAEDDADPVHFESDQEDYDVLHEKEEIDTLETSSVSSFSSETNNITATQNSFEYTLEDQQIPEEPEPQSNEPLPEPSAPLQDTQNDVIVEQDTTESNYQTDLDSAQPAYSGNADNFNTYYNPHLQQTTDKYVLNNKSYIFHNPSCDDVAKMAEENYATSNYSYDELQAQGYGPCGHCLEHYSNFNSGNYVVNNDTTSNNTNIDEPAPLPQNSDAVTYIINTKTRYFHFPNGCKYVNRYSAPEDLVSTNSSFNELRAQNYIPCKHCPGLAH